MEKKIIEIIIQTHLTPKEQANKVLDLFSVMLSEQEKDILNTYNDPLLKQYSKQVDRDTYKTNSLNVIRKLKERLHSA